MKKNSSDVAIEPRETMTEDISSYGRDEMNLAEFPITVLADRAPKGTKTLVFRAGKGQLTITGSDAYGLPTALDADVIVALIQLTKLRNDFKRPTINFTRYELLRLLGWNNEGRSYNRLHESLQRWVGVTLHYDNCWWDNRSKRYGDATLHILESAIILEGKTRIEEDGRQETLPLSSFTWNKDFLASCHADNLKYLDVGVYFSLTYSPAKRLYRFLDKRFYNRSSWVFDLAEIAFERVGLSRNYAPNVGKIKEKLQPAIDELEKVGFLEPLSREDRYFKEESVWKIRFDKQKTMPALPAPEDQPAASPLVKALSDRGITRVKAEEMVLAFPADRIAQKLDIFDWLVERADKRVHKNPAGWLFKAIQEDYSSPKGFQSREDRQKAQERQMAQEREIAEQHRLRREEQKREQEQRDAVETYLARLGGDELATLEAEAIAQAPEEIRKNIQRLGKDRLGQSLQRMNLRAFVAEKLTQGELSLT